MAANQVISISEAHGLAALPEDALNVYSVGISTAGVAELHMAELNPKRRIIATTVDKTGVDFANNFIAKRGMAESVLAKLEDVAGPLPYSDDSFDYIYARLVLHYLSKQDLSKALAELFRIVKSGGKIFVVVRSVECSDAQAPDSTYDDRSGLTTFHLKDEKGVSRSGTRFFHTEQSINDFVSDAGFVIDSVESYDEQLYKDFKRTQLSPQKDSLIELLAHKP